MVILEELSLITFLLYLHSARQHEEDFLNHLIKCNGFSTSMDKLGFSCCRYPRERERERETLLSPVYRPHFHISIVTKRITRFILLSSCRAKVSPCYVWSRCVTKQRTEVVQKLSAWLLTEAQSNIYRYIRSRFRYPMRIISANFVHAKVDESIAEANSVDGRKFWIVGTNLSKSEVCYVFHFDLLRYLLM